MRGMRLSAEHVLIPSWPREGRSARPGRAQQKKQKVGRDSPRGEESCMRDVVERVALLETRATMLAESAHARTPTPPPPLAAHDGHLAAWGVGAHLSQEPGIDRES